MLVGTGVAVGGAGVSVGGGVAAWAQPVSKMAAMKKQGNMQSTHIIAPECENNLLILIG